MVRRQVITTVGVLVACSNQRCVNYCSGTLIASRWMITAAHCAEAAFGDYAYYDHYFSVGEIWITSWIID